MDYYTNLKGFRLWGEALFFACAKESTQKKAHPGELAFGSPV